MLCVADVAASGCTNVHSWLPERDVRCLLWPLSCKPSVTPLAEGPQSSINAKSSMMRPKANITAWVGENVFREGG
jgi:hypothetical protein